MRILVVEDDAPLANFLSKGLEAEHYAVDVAPDGEEAKWLAWECEYDLMLLDLNLPKLDGLGLLHNLRPKRPSLPVLVMTARSKVEDRVRALDSGADDCMVKPFSFVEFHARVRALLRRSHTPVSRVSKVADLTLARDEHRVERGGRRIELTAREFDLLDCLMSNHGRPVSRNTLMKEVWNMPYDPSTNVVDVYVKYLRDKVDQGCETKLIRTLRGVGYVLADD